MTGRGVAPAHPGAPDLGADQVIDARMADLAVALPNRAPLSARAVAAGRRLTRTPPGVALCALWGLAVVVAGVTLAEPSTVAVRTPLGASKASCGLDVYLYRYPDHAVAAACRHAEMGRLDLFLPALVVIVAGVLLALAAAARSTPRPRAVVAARSLARRAPVRSALMVLGALAAAVALFALHPAPVELSLSGHPVSVSCGANAYFLGFPGSAVRAACQRAYGGQAHVLVDALAVTVVGVLALCSLLLSSARPPWPARRRLWAIGAALAAAVAVAAFLPVPVGLNEGGGPLIANCGVDSYVAGYPDQAVEAACRAHLTGHAITAGLAALLSLLALIGAWRSPRTRDRGHEPPDAGPAGWSGRPG
jgi:hypothetical protein